MIHLFIGGRHDGRRIDVLLQCDGEYPLIYELADTNPQPAPIGFGPPVSNVEVFKHTYRRYLLSTGVDGGRDIIAYYVHAHMDSAVAIRRLFDSYGK